MQEEAASGLEQWEMVVGAARLYDWSGGSRLRSPRGSLQRGLSSDSQAPDTLRTRQPPPSRAFPSSGTHGHLRLWSLLPPWELIGTCERGQSLSALVAMCGSWLCRCFHRTLRLPSGFTHTAPWPT